ncbi:MAG: dethiobiotin synthase [Acidimicrobiia bacterium]|nr:dethiobiotin synthase [Acidimicrobiia bacterium]
MTANRPQTLVLVSGTGTEVGKTWWAAATARALSARGLAVSARKPAQSFDPDEPTTDAEVLGAATGEDPATVCAPHRWYEVPMAPPMAAAALGRPSFSITDLVTELSWPAAADVGLVESVGGPRSPLAADGDTITLTERLAPDLVVLVADAGLGTINAVRLALDAFGTLAPVVVALNRYDDVLPLHRANRDWLEAKPGCSIVTDPADLADRL